MNITKPFFEGTLGWGYEPLHDHTGPFEVDIAAGARFGFGDDGLLIENGEGSAGRRAPASSPIPRPSPWSLTFSRQDDRRGGRRPRGELFRRRHRAVATPSRSTICAATTIIAGGSAMAGSSISSPTTTTPGTLRLGVAGYTEAVHKNFLLFTNITGDETEPADGSAVDPNAYLVTTQPDISLTDEEEVHRNTIAAVGGPDRFGESQLDYRGAYSRATFHVRRNIGADFRRPRTPMPFTYDNVTPAELPDLQLPGRTSNLNDPALYVLRHPAGNASNNQEYDVDEEYSGAANLQRPAADHQRRHPFKIGAEVRLRDKSADEYNETYRHRPCLWRRRPRRAGADLLRRPLQQRAADQPLRHPRSDQQRRAFGPAAPPVFNEPAYIAARENIYAGYAQVTDDRRQAGRARRRPRRGDRRHLWRLCPDLRRRPATWSATRSTARAVDYINVFPTVQVSYTVHPNLLLRAT